MVLTRDDIVGIDCAILMHPRVWEASGHIAGFTDPLVDCKKCKERFRADHLADAQLPARSRRSIPASAAASSPRRASSTSCSRPSWARSRTPPTSSSCAPRPRRASSSTSSTCSTPSRQKVPFGIAQIGKSFRNEITPGNFLFRTREFEQMEMEFFVKPGEDEQWFEYWTQARLDWYRKLRHPAARTCACAQHADGRAGALRQGLRRRRVRVPVRLVGARGHRQPHRLRSQAARRSSAARTSATSTRRRASASCPYVIEPAAGADRATLAFLVDAYDEDEAEGETRAVLRFHPRLAPVKAAVLPLLRKDGQPEKAQRGASTCCAPHFPVQYDQAGSIGRRYRRQDEIGTPFGITVDHQTMQDDTVTLRDRDTMQQERIPIDRLIG